MEPRYIVVVELAEGIFFYLWRGRLVDDIRLARKYEWPKAAKEAAKTYAHKYPGITSISVKQYRPVEK